MGLFNGILPLLKREYWGIRANTLLLLVIIILPLSLGLMFGTLKNIAPKSAPSGIFPEIGANEDDVRAADGILSVFSKTKIEQSMDENKLYREEFYFFVGVPKGFKKNATDVRVYIDSSMSPVAELSPYVRDMILYGLSQWYGRTPKLEIIAVGKGVLPFQYLVPGIAILLSAAVGLVIIPFSLSQDKEVLARVLPSVSTFSFAAGKLSFAAILAFLQVAILLSTQSLAGANGAFFLFSFWPALTLLCSAIFFTSLGISVMFLAKFGEVGKQINAGLMAAAVFFSGALYPVGFFPLVPGFGNILQEIGRSNPAYFFVILMRSFGLRNLAPDVVADYLGIALFLTVGSVLVFAYLVNRRKKHG